MKAILVHVDEAEKAAISEAAKVLGITRKAFIRRAAVDLAAVVRGRDKDLTAMIREIHSAVCGNGSTIPMSQEAQDAAAALIGLGHTKAMAEKRAVAISTAEPGLDAAGIIARACK